MPFGVGNAQGPATPVRVAAPTKFPISESGNIPVSIKTPFTSYTPVTFTVPDRPVSLEMKVSVPATGTNLPVILLSHGHGSANFLSSLHGYGPLADFWAAHGFIVIQPTHIDSKALGLRETNLPDAPTFFYSKVKDMHYILDHLAAGAGRISAAALTSDEHEGKTYELAGDQGVESCKARSRGERPALIHSRDEAIIAPSRLAPRNTR